MSRVIDRRLRAETMEMMRFRLSARVLRVTATTALVRGGLACGGLACVGLAFLGDALADESAPFDEHAENLKKIGQAVYLVDDDEATEVS